MRGGKNVNLDDSVKYLKGVGPKRAELLKKLGVQTVGDLLYCFPRGYIDLSEPVSIADTVLDEMNVISVRVVKKRPADYIRKNMSIYRVLCTDGESDITVVIYNSVYMYNRLKEGNDYILYGKVTGNLTTRQISAPMIIEQSSADRILPVYKLTDGISAAVMRTWTKAALDSVNLDSCEILDRDAIQKYGFMTAKDALRQIHFPSDREKLAAARKRLAFDELLCLQAGMFRLREQNRELSAYRLEDKPLTGFYNALPFELTGSQKQAISECVSDMCGDIPMNRLVLGDVGSGKTAVAAACCYFAYLNGCQSCLMAPTEILADQHYETLRGFLEPLGVRVALLKGAMTQKNKAEVKALAADGGCDVIVGTHALISAGTSFKKLALVITDEQHRFGVNQRGALSKKGENPHKLVMSATPIPRTLALMIYGELDISMLTELPKGRLKILTYAVTGKLRERAYGFVRKLLQEGRQAYVVCPAIDSSEESEEMPHNMYGYPRRKLKNVADCFKELSEGIFRDFRVGALHGQMPSDKKEEVMRAFKDGEIDLLVSTTVVEVGVDVPNAAVMLVEDADRFGLSQLHQLRGRVGRGKYQSYCILITDSKSDEARDRLRALTRASDGFKISEMDLKLRGPGDFFGEAQHGLPKLKIADAVSDKELLQIVSCEAERIYRHGIAAGSELERRVDKLFSGGAMD